jgi:hypothetical protein
MPSGPFPQLCFTVDGQQYSIDILSISDDGDALTSLGRMQLGPFTKLLLITPPGIPTESQLRRRGPVSANFLRAGDAKDINVEELGIAPDDGAVLVTVHAPLAWEGYTYEFFGTYEAPESPPDAPRFRLLGPMLDGVQYRLAPVTLIAWRRRAYCKHTPLYLEALWRPTMRETISIHGVELLSPPSSSAYKNAYKYMVDAHKLLHKLEGRGRPRGPRGFRNEEEFLDTLADIIRAVDSKGIHPTQTRIATFLREEIDTRLRDAGSATNAEDRINSTVRLIKKHLPCSWKAFVKNARASRKN